MKDQGRGGRRDDGHHVNIGARFDAAQDFHREIPGHEAERGGAQSQKQDVQQDGGLDVYKRQDVIILEDNPYGDLRFEGEALPPIKSMDTEAVSYTHLDVYKRQRSSSGWP